MLKKGSEPEGAFRDSAIRLFGLAVAGLSLALPAAAVEIDGIVAKVGTDAILQSDVANEIRRAGLQDESSYKDVLEDLIDRRLILKAAAEAKMTMQEWVVENRVREVINKMFGGDRNKLIDLLSKQRVSYPEWYAKTKEDLIIGAMRWNVVDKNVTASPAAIKKEFEENPQKYARDHKVSMTVIMLKPEESEKRKEISAALKDRDFEELGGKKYENVKPEDLFKPEIAKEIAQMPVGTISHWLELDGWSFLLRKDGETSASKVTLEEAYDEVEATVRAEEGKRLYKAWIKRLRDETYVKVF